MKRFLQNWLPALLLTALVTGAATASDGPNVMRRNVVSRSGDTMTGNLTMSAADVVLDTTEDICLNGSACTMRMEATSTPEIIIGNAANTIFFAINTSTGTARVTHTMNSQVGSGANAFAATTNGARFDYGSGASDYATSNGTTVTFAGPVTVTGALQTTGASGDITLTGGDLASSLTSQTFNITSATADTTTSTTVAAITLAPTANITAGDLVLEVNDSAGASLFTIDEEGDTILRGSTGFFVGQGTVNVIESLSTTLVFDLTSDMDDATASPTQHAIGINTLNDLTTGDLVLVVQDVGVNLFGVTAGYGPKMTLLNGTAGSGTGFTTVYTGQMTHRVHAITLDETALADADGSEDETVWTVPAKTRSIRMIADVTVAFAGTGITDVKVVCGDTAGGNSYLISFDADAIAVYGDVAAEIGADLLSATVADVPSWSATTALICRFTCTGANCNAMTAGSMTFYIEHLVYP